MTSKKPPASKRANLPRASDYTKGFLKDWQRLSHSGRYDMNRLEEVMTLLIANDTNTLRTKSAGLPDGCFGREAGFSLAGLCPIRVENNLWWK